MNTRFLNRFHRLWARKRRVQFGQALATTALIGAIALCLLAAADYALELSIGWRTGLLALAAATVAVFGGRALWKAARLGARPKTAEEMEKAFPQLGQSVRTTVQYVPMQAGELKSQGVAESLVSALADNTESQTRPLPLDVVIPSKLFWGLTAGVLAVCMVAAAASAFDWEWRTAAQRIALGDGAYRSLEVSPGDVLVDEGHSTDLSVTLVGRADRDVVLQTRQANTEDAEWTDQTLEPAKGGDEKPAAHTSSKPPRKSFTSHLVRLTEPVEYRVAAAGIVSPTYRIDIRRPVKIESMKVELTPPTYTRQATATISDGNISALAGTEARWTVRFDKPVKSAAFVFAVKRVATDTAEPEPETIPLTLSADSKEGSATATNIGQTDMVLNEDRNYSITAEAIDGTVLAPAKYRIRIREDQPPQVSFESPMDGIEVHALAELPVRVRVSDDYGLTTSGVMFQVNNEQVIPLISEDFAAVVDAAKEAEETGTLSPTTQKELERILPLEHFALTQKDSVMYYAFAEDNRPGTPQRTETDMRFIDIRPFKRSYQLIDPDPMPGGNGGGPGIKSLEELIQRQRYGLNRTLNIERKALAGQIPDASSLDQLMTFETELAQNTRDTALGLEARGFDDTELFYQAESSMLQAVDSLSVGKWENATLQMRDALKSLIEQRDRALAFIMKNPDPAQLAALRAFDRLQAQKLRRPKTDKEEARELIRRLEALIGQEQSVVSGLDEGSAKPKDEEQPAGDAEEPKTETPADSEGTPAEPAAVEAPAA
jgi:hypothetical protein